MEVIAIVTGLAVLQSFLFAFLVGKERVRHGIGAPAMSGNADFDRAFRVHANTVEQLVIFIPGLWMFGYYVNAMFGAGLGLLFIIGRFVYRNSYVKNPQQRSAGFGIGALAMVVLVVGGMVGAGLKLM